MSSSTYHPLPANESQLPLVSPPLTHHHHHHPARFDSHPSRSRLKFFVLRVILPLLSLLLLLTLVIIPATLSNQFSFKQCQDGSCLKWDKVHDLAQNWGLGFQKLSPTAGPIRSKLKILHLVDKDTAEVLMDRWLLHSHDAFLARPDLVSSAILWGPDFEGWKNTLSLTQNIAQKFGSADHFDAVLVYFNNDQVKFLHIDSKPWFAQVKELSQQGNGVVIIDRPHEMRDLRKAEFYNLANVTLVLAPYAYELFEYRSQFATQALLVHQPHFIDKKIFYHPVGNTRPEDIIIAGDLGAFYPFRARLADMIRKKTLPGWIRGHPGYEDIKSADQRNKKLTAEIQEQQLVDFGNDFGRAKICLVTDSRWAYSVQKYVEAAAAGCLIAGNIPLDRQAMFEKVIVPLSNKDSDDKIITTLNWWLKHDQERISKAQAAQDWILNSFSMDRYAEDVWKMIWFVKEGQRGMILPYEFDFLPKDLPEDG
ncbi:hypothetical protein PGT21_032338 [Puccinia graminis f. sp. tritici]|uniref:Uncharacterized protein n=1 Tax=Puccinia graminis f. sp. tritici TaxID=56615 RepID=A0A5B0R512_PUCGR|nr:hypothetical protein PGT21_032338 [Puccinia graminis f. sp. tritici]KAA1120597.1 hypothetical protein PGTUg99_006019 [Puccinia graminis f. sp. tritici]